MSARASKQKLASWSSGSVVALVSLSLCDAGASLEDSASDCTCVPRISEPEGRGLVRKRMPKRLYVSHEGEVLGVAGHAGGMDMLHPEQRRWSR